MMWTVSVTDDGCAGGRGSDVRAPHLAAAAAGRSERRILRQYEFRVGEDLGILQFALVERNSSRVGFQFQSGVFEDFSFSLACSIGVFEDFSFSFSLVCSRISVSVWRVPDSKVGIA